MNTEHPIVKILNGIFITIVVLSVYHYIKNLLNELFFSLKTEHAMIFDAFFLGVLLILGIVYILTTQRKIGDMILCKKISVKVILLSGLTGITFHILFLLLIKLCGFKNVHLSIDMISNAPYLYFLSVLLLIIIIPVLEELIFRGIVFSRLRNTSYLFLAIVFQTIIYGVFQTPMIMAIYNMVLGIIASLLLIKAKSIIPALIFHVSANLTFFLSGIFMI